MKTSKKEDYAIVLMSALAKNYNEYISLKSVSDKYKLPYPFMKQISNDLVNSNLLKTKGGAFGGYKLAKSPKDISWREILVAVSGEPQFAKCVGNKEICPVLSKCPAASAWSEVQCVILQALDNVKLSDFLM